MAEYVFQRETEDHGDLGKRLAAGISQALTEARIPYPVYDPGQGIRATVIGASQFSVQVSGNTIMVSDPAALPLRNVPVVRLELDMSADFGPGQVAAEIGKALSRFDIVEGETTVALAFRWQGEPLHARIFALAQGICQGLPETISSGKPVIVMMDGDLGRTLGEVLRRELDVANDIVSVDGVDLKNFDFVDIGEVIEPTRVVTMVIKSLLFPAEDSAGHG